MKKLMKSISLALVAIMTASTISSIPANVSAATNITISPFNTCEINNGVFEGWGTSLCWWANRIGYSDSLSQQAADLFYGDDGLRMNIARFNIGGGDDPSHNHITRTDSNMPGYTTYKNGKATYNWNADSNQRNVLMRSIAAAGDDMIVEMFSNSPPYYMTNSGCSSGANKASDNNLRDDCYDDFAEYFAEVCLHYEKDWGVDIQSVTPMNEPYTNYWAAYSNKQEGCHFNQGTSQTNMILELQKSMDKRGLGDIIISGTDETSIDTQINSYNKLSSDAKKAIDRIDTHTYGGSKRSQLKDLAVNEGKNLWMSEVDGGSTAGTNAGQMGSALWLANRITLDLNELNASAWILWQAIDRHVSKDGYNGNKDTGMPNLNGGFWGLAIADHDKNDIVLTKKYYSFGQFSRYIRPGMIMLKSSSSTVAAYDPKNHQLVIVASNNSGSKSDLYFDLSGFSSIGSTAQVIRTSANENWANAGTVKTSGSGLSVSLPANSISTFIIDGVTGGSLENQIEVTNDMVSGSNPWNNSDNNCYKVFDGNNSTFFDGVGNGWVQVDLGKVYDLSAIGYAPRSGFEYRCPDAYFSVSTDGENWHTIHTITNKPAGIQYVTSFSGSTEARYVRYQVPEGKPSNQWNDDDSYCCNIAEIKLYGTVSPVAGQTKLVPTATSGSNPWKEGVNDHTKAFDGDINTYFDGVGDGWIQADLGGFYNITTIGYAPRKGFEYRCPDSIIEVSLDGKNWTKISTVASKPTFAMQYIQEFSADTTARYVRYSVPTGAPKNEWNDDDAYCCNVAELEIYGEPAENVTIQGDINGDGTVSVADAALLQKWLLQIGEAKTATLETADLSGDGRVNVLDLAMLKNLLTAQ